MFWNQNLQSLWQSFDENWESLWQWLNGNCRLRERQKLQRTCAQLERWSTLDIIYIFFGIHFFVFIFCTFRLLHILYLEWWSALHLYFGFFERWSRIVFLCFLKVLQFSCQYQCFYYPTLNQSKYSTRWSRLRLRCILDTCRWYPQGWLYSFWWVMMRL